MNQKEKAVTIDKAMFDLGYAVTMALFKEVQKKYKNEPRKDLTK